MIRVAVGIDIGTSYTKAVARTEDGSVVAQSRLRSPPLKSNMRSDILRITDWWLSLKDALLSIQAVEASLKLRIAAVSISTIAPTLVVFDAAKADDAFVIPYLSQAEHDDGTLFPQDDQRLTERRLAALREAAKKERFAKPFISDLVGYFNWRLTGRLTMNSISLVETGMLDGVRDCDRFAVSGNDFPILVAPCEQIGDTTKAVAKEIGIEAGIPVSGGCPDTMSSIVGAGLKCAFEKMLYLGTFGSVLLLERDVDSLLNIAHCHNKPYRWLLSVPDFGPEIEKLSMQWFGAASHLQTIDHEAMQAPPGAEGTLFLVPRWKNGMNPIGGYELLPSRSGEVGSVQRRSRAVLEGLAYAILALDANSNEAIKASGGGSRSESLLTILSVVLNSSIQVRHMAWEAVGTADIAASLLWKKVPPNRPCFSTGAHFDVPRGLINDNFQRIKEHYHELEWL